MPDMKAPTPRRQASGLSAATWDLLRFTCGLRSLPAVLQADDGSGAAQWQLTYLMNGAYRVSSVRRGLDNCQQTVLTSTASGDNTLSIVDKDDRCGLGLADDARICIACLWGRQTRKGRVWTQVPAGGAHQHCQRRQHPQHRGQGRQVCPWPCRCVLKFATHA